MWRYDYGYFGFFENGFAFFIAPFVVLWELRSISFPVGYTHAVKSLKSYRVTSGSVLGTLIKSLKFLIVVIHDVHVHPLMVMVIERLQFYAFSSDQVPIEGN